ncbi:hypothetical protein HNP55_001844 [Paucibacter oligotrophus]|uniref:Uncharacterized protein n=1 Tax=Roseateles oligotrophus TaxID=1769250 RepID=A0A840L994_9BURK|nr:hypothetical protein [Roseateles oligotrophus]MBB4843325.1 hypothetical protein [Roseateles oligotrophus]
MASPKQFSQAPQGKIYSWSLWKHVERDWMAKGGDPLKMQRERWHLRAHQQEVRMRQLAQWLCARLALVAPDVRVRLASLWVDHTPQAHGSYDAGGVPQPFDCELADLLIVVRTECGKGSGATVSQRGLLLQAKVAADVDQLDPGYGDSSTVSERNLLELLCSPLDITVGTASTSSRLPGGPYLLQEPGRLGLAHLARYLQIAEYRKKGRHKPPYQLLWPSARTAAGGRTTGMGAALLGLSELSSAWPLLGTRLDAGGSAVEREFDRLAQNLGLRYLDRSLGRFKAMTGQAVPRLIDTGDYQYGGVLRPLQLWLRSLLSPGLALLLRYSVAPLRLFALAPAAPVFGPPPPPPVEGEDAAAHIPILYVLIRTEQQRPDQSGSV